MTVEEAKRAYREAWSSYCLTSDPEKRQELERVMDSLQPKIAPGPNEAWKTFAKSLPGFVEFWDRWHRESTEKYREGRSTE